MKKVCLFLVALLFSVNIYADVLVEAENFLDKGGWLLDHQAYPKIGSAYLFSNGKGDPSTVLDAYTVVKFAEAGEYYVYVSTFNWTSKWYDGKGGGAFQVLVNGRPVCAELGVTGDKWGWELAGKVTVKAGDNKVALRDLTGFNGRCDAIYFAREKQTLPDSYKELLAFRKEKLGIERKVLKDYDLVVVGGGVAGCATALSAARYGMKVAIVDNLPEFGGNNYLNVGLCGAMHKNLYPQLGNMVCQLSMIDVEDKNDPSKYSKSRSGTTRYLNPHHHAGEPMANHREKLLISAGVDTFHLLHAFDITKSGDKITSVIARDLLTSQEYEFCGDLFADCTGDGDVGYLAGADFMMGREDKSFANEPTAPEVGDQKKMGLSISWRAANVGKPTSFPTLSEIPWAAQCTAESFSEAVGSRWWWESGMEVDNALDAEYARDIQLRSIYGNWSYMKNNLPKYKNFKLLDMQHYGKKRESRRLVGDLVLNENDIKNQVQYPDASFTTTWTLDLHYATAENTKYFPGAEFLTECPNDDKNSWIQPYHVPYRVLYSKSIDNLFMPSRCMSVTHVALGTVRVMATLGMAGEVVGMAAKICHDKRAMPRDVYAKYLKDLKRKMVEGVPLE